MSKVHDSRIEWFFKKEMLSLRYVSESWSDLCAVWYLRFSIFYKGGFMIKLTGRTGRGIVVDVAEKYGQSEFNVFQLYSKHMKFQNENLTAQLMYESYCDGEDISEEMTDFCIDAMIADILPYKATNRRHIA